MKVIFASFALVVLVAALARAAEAEGPVLRSGDVVALIGGEDIVAAQRNSYLETLLSRHLRGQEVRFRNLGWEGDTVFEQRRELNYPGLLQQLERFGVTVVVAQFGQAESLRGSGALREFVGACEKLVEGLSRSNRQVVLISPTPFGAAADFPANEATQRNAVLAIYVTGLREVAQRRGLRFVDLFTPLRTTAEGREPLTRDGLHLSAQGHWLAAREMARELGFKDDLHAPSDLRSGALRDARAEAMRQAIIAKNRLWFDYTRPQNWAFLGGDRTSQPSSRDHRDPKVRWFPAEMEKFVPLIEAKEKEIAALAEERR